ncbi:hypothetical protein D1007_22888 [Hordeum vulgare]|nr:hypothetical protein D1007_22888 [Hordeum vulgare]
MFQFLERRAQRGLRTIYKESIFSPLVPDNVSYLDFFTKVVERLEESAKKVVLIIEEECCDLLGKALTLVFIHLHSVSLRFEFEAMTALFPRSSRLP